MAIVTSYICHIPNTKISHNQSYFVPHAVIVDGDGEKYPGTQLNAAEKWFHQPLSDSDFARVYYFNGSCSVSTAKYLLTTLGVLKQFGGESRQRIYCNITDITDITDVTDVTDITRGAK